MKKLREFRKWPLREVRETARMLYALRQPFAPDEKSDIKWNSLAQQAFDFLDKLHNACAEIARRRRGTDAAYRRSEQRSEEAAALPDPVPFPRAIKFITRQARPERAERKFKELVLSNAKYFGNATEKELRAQIRRWRKEGIPRDEAQPRPVGEAAPVNVMELQSLYDDALRIAREKREAKRREQGNKRKRKARGPRLNPEDKPIIGEVLREKRAREV